MGALPYTIVEPLRLNGESRFFLFQSDLKLSGESAVLREAGNGIPTFGNVDEARAYAVRTGLKAEPEVGTHVYDLDAVRAWCGSPSPNSLDATQLFMAWMLLAHAGVTMLPGAPPEDVDSVADHLIDWLTTHMTGTDDPPPGWEPHRWTADEARELAHLLRPHVEQFVLDLRRPAA